VQFAAVLAEKKGNDAMEVEGAAERRVVGDDEAGPSTAQVTVPCIFFPCNSPSSGSQAPVRQRVSLKAGRLACPVLTGFRGFEI